MNLIGHKYTRLIPAIYFMLLGIVCILMELQNNTLSVYWLFLYALGSLPIIIPVKHFWIFYGLTLSMIFGLILLVELGWLIQYLNGEYFKYPFDTFVTGPAFIIFSMVCSICLFNLGLKSRDTILIRLKS